VQDLAEAKLDALLNGLPTCTFAQARQLAEEGISGDTPPCIPRGFSEQDILSGLGADFPGLTMDQISPLLGFDVSLLTDGLSIDRIKEELGDALVDGIRSSIGDAIPAEFTYTDTDLRETLGEDDEETLDNVLEWTRVGYSYTDTDLREDLTGDGDDTSDLDMLDQVLEWGREGLAYTDADLRDDLVGDDGDTSNLDRLDQVLEWTSEGFTVTEIDLQEAIESDAGNSTTFADIDRYRKLLGTAREFSFLLYVVPGLLLAAIGFLGGRGWRGRLTWAAVTLGVTAALAFAALGPVYRGFAEPRIDELIVDATADAREGATVLETLVIDKAVTVARSVADAFRGGLTQRSLLFLIIGAAGLALSVLWPAIARLFGGGIRYAPAPAEPGPEETEAPERQDDP
jgi:hypothetical protein